jgi:hypothetical protein
VSSRLASSISAGEALAAPFGTYRPQAQPLRSRAPVGIPSSFDFAIIEVEQLRRLRPLTDGAEWHLVVPYPSRHKERISGFKNLTEALNWIGSPPCMEWVKQRGYQ